MTPASRISCASEGERNENTRSSSHSSGPTYTVLIREVSAAALTSTRSKTSRSPFERMTVRFVAVPTSPGWTISICGPTGCALQRVLSPRKCWTTRHSGANWMITLWRTKARTRTEMRPATGVAKREAPRFGWTRSSCRDEKASEESADDGSGGSGGRETGEAEACRGAAGGWKGEENGGESRRERASATTRRKSGSESRTGSPERTDCGYAKGGRFNPAKTNAQTNA